MKRITAYLTMMLALTFSVQLYAQDNNEGEENEGKKRLRLVLSANVAKIVRSGMNLLGIEMPERM